MLQSIKRNARYRGPRESQKFNFDSHERVADIYNNYQVWEDNIHLLQQVNENNEQYKKEFSRKIAQARAKLNRLAKEVI